KSYGLCTKQPIIKTDATSPAPVRRTCNDQKQKKLFHKHNTATISNRKGRETHQHRRHTDGAVLRDHREDRSRLRLRGRLCHRSNDDFSNPKLGQARRRTRSRCHPRTHRIRSDRKSTRLNSSHEWISYAVFCLKK